MFALPSPVRPGKLINQLIDVQLNSETAYVSCDVGYFIQINSALKQLADEIF